MIRKLKIKFIGTMMAIVTVMLCVIFGLIFYFTHQAVETQTFQIMQTVGERPGYLRMTEHQSGEEQEPFPFFVVQSRQNQEPEVFGSSGFEEADLARIVETVLQAGGEGSKRGEKVGILPEYGLRYLRSPIHGGERITFASLEQERAVIRRLAFKCAGLGLGSLLVFFGISTLLAGLMVHPVERAWQQQRQFVADASHELKTPLTVIITNAELLEYPDYDQETKKQFTQGILSMSRKMHGLVNSMLELTRIDNGAVDTPPERLNLSDLLTGEIGPYEALFYEKDRDLTQSIPPEIYVQGSDKHLRQLLGILLDNALKYSVGEGSITVALTRQGGHCLLRVSNPGEELSGEEKQNLFKRFYRGDKARRMNGSYGLGLSIAQGIVELHKGKIWVQSKEGYNTFFVQLPTVP